MVAPDKNVEFISSKTARRAGEKVPGAENAFRQAYGRRLKDGIPLTVLEDGLCRLVFAVAGLEVEGYFVHVGQMVYLLALKSPEFRKDTAGLAVLRESARVLSHAKGGKP